MIDTTRRYLPPARDVVLPDGRTVVVRCTVPDDAPSLLASLRQVGGESSFLTFGAEGIPLDETGERALIERFRATDNALALVAVEGDRVVGSLTFEGGPRQRIRHTGELGIALQQAYTGMGVGRALLETLIEWAEGSGIIRKLDLKVRADNVAAIRLYEKLGWRVEGRVTRDLCVDGTFHDAIYMGRPVDP